MYSIRLILKKNSETLLYKYKITFFKRKADVLNLINNTIFI